MGSEEFLQVPNGWSLIPLIDCTTDQTITYGIVQPGSHTDNGIPIVRVNNFSQGGLDTSSVMKVSPEVESKYRRTRLQGGEVLLTLVGSTGQSAIAPPQLAGWNVPRAVAVIRPSDDIGARWIHISLQSQATKNYLDSRANTTVQKTLNLQDVRSIPILLPPPATKDFIERTVSALDDKIALNHQTNITLESMAQALFKSWFVDFDPVIDNALAAGNPIPEALKARADARAALGHQRKSLPDHIRQQFPDRFVETEEMGWVPEGWRPSDVGTEFDVTMGQSPPGDTYNKTGVGMPFFQGRADFGFRYPSNRIHCTAPKRLAQKGDALVSVRAPVGDVNMAASDCCIGRGVSASKHKSGCRSFTYYAMLELREHFKVYESEGTVFGSINQKNFKALKHLVIPNALVQMFEKQAGPFDERIENSTHEIASLTSLRDTLLPKLLSGELRIPEAEQQVEEVI